MVPIAIFFLISINFKDYNFSMTDILSIESMEELNLTGDIFAEIASNLEDIREKGKKTKKLISHFEIKQLIERFSDKYDIENKESIIKRKYIF